MKLEASKTYKSFTYKLFVQWSLQTKEHNLTFKIAIPTDDATFGIDQLYLSNIYISHSFEHLLHFGYCVVHTGVAAK